MVNADEALADLLDRVERLAKTMPAELEYGFWGDIVEPVAKMIVRNCLVLSPAEQLLLLAVAAKASRCADQEQEALDEAAAVIHRAGGVA